MMNGGESATVESAEALREQAAMFARYIAGGPAQGGIVERFVDACRRLQLDQPVGEDAALLAFVRGHPSSLALLDAACGVVRPEALLRKKLFVMLALLETSPAHATLFLPTPRGLIPAAGRLAVRGLAASVTIIAGLLIYPLARGAR